MSLSLTNALADPQSQMDSMRRALADAVRERDELRQEIRDERQKNAAIERGVQELRAVLSPLYSGLRHIFGEIEAMGATSVSLEPQKKAVWEDWKQKLGGLPAKAIEALLIHGEMNRAQLRIQVGCATRSVTDIVYKLNQAGLINKNGGKISLKQL